MLLNQEDDGGHFSRTLPGAQGDRQQGDKTDEKFISAWGLFQFKRHDELATKFLKNNCLKFAIATVIHKKPTSSAQIVETEV